MTRREHRPPGQRQLRVGEEIRHALAWILERGEAHDPGLAGAVVTVTEVRVSPDLRNATAYVMPLGGAEAETVLAALERAAPFLRRRVAEEVRLRVVPRLAFAADTSFDEADRIENLLGRPDVARDLAGPDGDGDDGA